MLRVDCSVPCDVFSCENPNRIVACFVRIGGAAAAAALLVVTCREVYRMGFLVYHRQGTLVLTRSCACLVYIRLDPEKRE
jgi:hypothetical protein